jgi:alkaline phosphatase D
MRMLPLLPCFLFAMPLWAQSPINGPMVGHVDMLEARIWMQCHGPCTAALQVWPQGAPDSVVHVPAQRSVADRAHAMEFVVAGVRPGRTYEYQVAVDGITIPFEETLSFRTQPIWRHRTDAPDFTVAMGSCTYINEEAYDRPGKPYGGDYQIFDAIADKTPDMMLWLGDNVYLREPDWGSRSGYLHRYTHTRSAPEMQRLLRSTKHYAIWDDHDFGPNDSNGSWVHSEVAREVFDLFWPNPTCGVPGVRGTTTMFSHADMDFFLLDNRTHRVPGNVRTLEPAMLGAAQLDWLIQALKYSRAPFKLVAVGSQVLHTEALHETYANMPAERNELLRRIEEEGITGVVFLTGDRHFSELSALKLKDGRMIYDITVSPLTSGHYDRTEPNRNRVEGTLVHKRNFAVLSFTGPARERSMGITLYDAQGAVIWERSIQAEPFKR